MTITVNNLGRGVKPTRYALVKLIKASTAIDLHQPANAYFKHVDKLIETRGMISALTRLKQEYHVALNYYLDQPNPGYPYLATTSGFPRAIIALRYLKEKGPSGIQAGLTLLGYFRGLKSYADPNFDPITDQGVRPASYVMEQIANQCVESIDLTMLSQPTHLLRSKQGPNGQATTKSVLDLQALEEDPIVLDNLLGFLEESEEHSKYELEFKTSLETLLEVPRIKHPHVKHSKLSIKYENGGKSRIFAIVDYFTQCALEPLHNALAGILSNLKQDSTWNQDRGAAQVRDWTLEPILTPLYSFDLTAATDRFPICLQELILSKLTKSSEYGKRWAKLISERDFHYKKKTYRWSVGQPLGAYSSWPMFALSHHMVVRYAAQVSGAPLEYVLLGDDIVIRGEELGKSYLKVMSLLGVDINLSKSLTGKSGEFAKRVFTKGYEVSAVPMQLFKECTGNFQLLRTLQAHLNTRMVKGETAVSEQTIFNIFKRFYSPKMWEDVLILLTFPIKGSVLPDHASEINSEGVISWHNLESIPRNTFIKLYKETKWKHFINRYSNSVADRANQLIYLQSCELTGLSSDLLADHPATRSLERRENLQVQAFREIGYLQETWLEEDTNSLYLPPLNLPTLKGFIPSVKEKRIGEAKVIREAYNTIRSNLTLSV